MREVRLSEAKCITQNHSGENKTQALWTQITAHPSSTHLSILIPALKDPIFPSWADVDLPVQEEARKPFLQDTETNTLDLRNLQNGLNE